MCAPRASASTSSGCAYSRSIRSRTRRSRARSRRCSSPAVLLVTSEIVPREYCLRCERGEPDPERRRSGAGASGADRRGSAGRRGHARRQGAPRTDLGADPAGRAALGGALPRVRVAGGLGALVYFAILLAAIVVFSRTRDFGQFLRVGQLAILLAPTLSMIPLGGFLASGGVGLWGILAPLGALVFSAVRTAARWYVAYVVVFLSSGIAGELLGGVSPAVPEWFTSTMLALNVTVGGTIVFTLLALFADQRRNALAALRVEQAKAESLLLNILPRPIADKLKAEPQTIADQFSAASILFADVVDFTPLSERLPPAEVVGLLDRLFSHFDVLAER